MKNALPWFMVLMCFIFLVFYEPFTPPQNPTGDIPMVHYDMKTQQTTTSASLVPIPSTDVNLTITRRARIFAIGTFDANTLGAGQAIGKFGLSIDTNVSDPLTRFFSGVNDRGIGAVAHASGILDPGTYTIMGMFARESGTGVVAVQTFQIIAWPNYTDNV